MQARVKPFLFILLSFLGLTACTENYPPLLITEVLVVGGGASGTPAAIQASRGGADVVLIEETPWLGGMLTAAGVGATDGNHKMPAGLWGEFRQKIRDYYGGAEAVETGWVSNTLFEPHVGNKIWNEMADAESSLQRLHGYHITAAEMEGEYIHQLTFENKVGEKLKVRAEVYIDATELGDLIALSGADFLTGNDSKDNPHDDNIQDLTYVAVLKDFGTDADKTIEKPEGYDPSEFECICKELCDDPERDVPDCETFLRYGRMPNGKYMINWPNNGNDYFLNPIPMSFEERLEAYKAAKARTLDLVYLLQSKAAYKNLGLADDEFPTDDLLPFIPYHRESRRIKGEIQFKVADILDPYADPDRKFYQQAIAVGDYPLDLHHDKNPNAPEETFPPVPSFSIPYQALLPEKISNLIAAEKSISVTHRANGSTRLQPCVMLIGQAAGMAAAMASKEGLSPKDISIRNLQENLLNANCWLMPFIDTKPEDWFFDAAQKAGVSGVIKGHGVPYKWANQTWFYPDSTLTRAEFNALRPSSRLDIPEPDANEVLMTREMLLQLLDAEFRMIKPESDKVIFTDVDAQKYPRLYSLKEKGYFKHWAEKENFYPNKVLTRKEAVWIVNQLWPFFER
ncbi:MAG: FAD-dependent oxidoreductase [Bacteroidota bacterium]